MNVYVHTQEFYYRSIIVDIDNQSQLLPNFDLLNLNKSISDQWVNVEAVFYEEDDDASKKREQSLSNCDFPYCWGLCNNVYSSNAYELLKDKMKHYGEFLPLYNTDICDHLYYFHVLNMVDALDTIKSEYTFFPQSSKRQGFPKQIDKIHKYVFIEEVIKDNMIFNIPNYYYKYGTYYTQQFVDLVNSHHLTGFNFVKVYPDEDLRKAEMEKYMAKRRKKS